MNDCFLRELGNGWVMAEPMNKVLAEMLYDGLDEDELAELEAVKCDRNQFITDVREAERSAAFITNDTLMFGICSNKVNIPTIGECLLWDTMSTKAVRQGGMKSIKGFLGITPKMRDAFLEGEPDGLPIVGIVKSDFARSRKWIEKVVGFKHHADCELFGVKHSIYIYHKIKREEA